MVKAATVVVGDSMLRLFNMEEFVLEEVLEIPAGLPVAEGNTLFIGNHTYTIEGQLEILFDISGCFLICEDSCQVYQSGEFYRDIPSGVYRVDTTPEDVRLINKGQG